MLLFFSDEKWSALHKICWLKIFSIILSASIHSKCTKISPLLASLLLTKVQNIRLLYFFPFWKTFMET